MSIRYSNRMYLIPTDQNYVPDDLAAHQAWLVLRSFLPEAEAVIIVVYPAGDHIFAELSRSKLTCPSCAAILIDTTLNQRNDQFLAFDKWWVSVRSGRRKGQDTTVMPCCGATFLISDLGWRPYGYAHFALEVEQPSAELSAEQLDELGHILDCEVIAQWNQYYHTSS